MANAQQAETVAALKSITQRTDGLQVLVAGYYAPNDGGGGVWRWDEDSDEQPNDGSVIGIWRNEPPFAWLPGRWLLVRNGTVATR